MDVVIDFIISSVVKGDRTTSHAGENQIVNFPSLLLSFYYPCLSTIFFGIAICNFILLFIYMMTPISPENFSQLKFCVEWQMSLQGSAESLQKL